MAFMFLRRPALEVPVDLRHRDRERASSPPIRVPVSQARAAARAVGLTAMPLATAAPYLRAIFRAAEPNVFVFSSFSHVLSDAQQRGPFDPAPATFSSELALRPCRPPGPACAGRATYPDPEEKTLSHRLKVADRVRRDILQAEPVRPAPPRTIRQPQSPRRKCGRNPQGSHGQVRGRGVILLSTGFLRESFGTVEKRNHHDSTQRTSRAVQPAKDQEINIAVVGQGSDQQRPFVAGV